MLDEQTVHGAEGTTDTRNLYQRFSAGVDRVYARVEGAYKRLLGASIDRPGIVLSTGVALLALALIAVKVGVVKTETFPASSSRFVSVNVRTPNGTAVAVTNSVARTVEDALLHDPRVADVSVTVGSAFTGAGSRVVTNQASMAVALKSGINGTAADDFVNGVGRRGWEARSGAPVRPSGRGRTPHPRATRSASARCDARWSARPRS